MTHLRLRPCSEEMIYLEKTCTVNHVLWKMFKIQKSFFHGALNFWPIKALEKKVRYTFKPSSTFFNKKKKHFKRI